MIRALAVGLAVAIGMAPAAWAQRTPTDPVPGPTTAQGERTGANSFTEDQARRRMEEAGLRSIHNLQLGEDGVWRAGALTPEGRTVQVTMDYQGSLTLRGAQQ